MDSTRRSSSCGDSGPRCPRRLSETAPVGLAQEGKSAEAVTLDRLRCELYPNSWIAQRALADRLLDEGDCTGATTAYRKAQELIAAGAKPPASEWARKLIANGLKKAERPTPVSR